MKKKLKKYLISYIDVYFDVLTEKRLGLLLYNRLIFYLNVLRVLMNTINMMKSRPN